MLFLPEPPHTHTGIETHRYRMHELYFANHLTPTRVLKLFPSNAIHFFVSQKHLTPSRVLKRWHLQSLILHFLFEAPHTHTGIETENYLKGHWLPFWSTSHPHGYWNWLPVFSRSFLNRTTSHPHGYWNNLSFILPYWCWEPPHTLTGIETWLLKQFRTFRQNHLTPSRVLKQWIFGIIKISKRTTSHPHGYWNPLSVFQYIDSLEPPHTHTGIETLYGLIFYL